MLRRRPSPLSRLDQQSVLGDPWSRCVVDCDTIDLHESFPLIASFRFRPVAVGFSLPSRRARPGALSLPFAMRLTGTVVGVILLLFSAYLTVSNRVTVFWSQ